MTEPRTGPCAEWTDAAHVGACIPCKPDDFDEAMIAETIDAASEALWALSGRQFSGECTEVVRPVRSSALWDRFPSAPGNGWGWYLGNDWCWCGDDPRRAHESCPLTSETGLDVYPVTGITEVLVDGAVLPASSYRVDDFRWLVRLDGDRWPCCQDLTADPAVDDDTFQITFTHGLTVPALGARAAAVLACELYKACTNDDNCRLPRQVVTVTRQGVTMVTPGLSDLIGDGKTGLAEVDLFLHSVNPAGLRRRGAVFAPQRHRRVRRVGTDGGGS